MEVAIAAAVAAFGVFGAVQLAYIPNRSLHAAVARFTGGLSPAALSEAYLDWATHLANAPGKRLQLTEKAVRKAMRFARYAYQYAIDAKTPENCIVPLPQDHRMLYSLQPACRF
jgi:polyhydroxyalkanoate synthase subunit PhaC